VILVTLAPALAGRGEGTLLELLAAALAANLMLHMSLTEASPGLSADWLLLPSLAEWLLVLLWATLLEEVMLWATLLEEVVPWAALLPV